MTIEGMLLKAVRLKKCGARWIVYDDRGTIVEADTRHEGQILLKACRWTFLRGLCRGVDEVNGLVPHRRSKRKG